MFLNRRGNKLRGQRDWFDPAIEKSGIEGVTCYCLRHTFAGRLVVARVDMRTVGELMGHSG